MKKHIFLLIGILSLSLCSCQIKQNAKTILEESEQNHNLEQVNKFDAAEIQQESNFEIIDMQNEQGDKISETDSMQEVVSSTEVLIEEFKEYIQGYWMFSESEFICFENNNFCSGAYPGYIGLPGQLQSIKRQDDYVFEVSIYYPETVDFGDVVPAHSQTIVININPNNKKLEIVDDRNQKFNCVFVGKTFDELKTYCDSTKYDSIMLKLLDAPPAASSLGLPLSNDINSVLSVNAYSGTNFEAKNHTIIDNKTGERVLTTDFANLDDCKIAIDYGHDSMFLINADIDDDMISYLQVFSPHFNRYITNEDEIAEYAKIVLTPMLSLFEENDANKLVELLWNEMAFLNTEKHRVSEIQELTTTTYRYKYSTVAWSAEIHLYITRSITDWRTLNGDVEYYTVVSSSAYIKRQ